MGFFDALGCSKGCDVTKFKRRRQVELKHGRAAMLAAMGYITPEYFRFPGLLSMSSNLKVADLPSGVAALSKMIRVYIVEQRPDASSRSRGSPPAALASRRSPPRGLAEGRGMARGRRPL